MKNNKYMELLNISKEIGMSVERIMTMLSILNKEKSLENNDLLRRVGVSKNVLNQVKERLADWLEPAGAMTALSSKGQMYMGETDGENLNIGLEQIEDLLEKYQNLRHKEVRGYDQFTATNETTAKRAILMEQYGDVRGKRVLFLGDDDWGSLAVGSFKTAKEVMALDIDERIVNTINKIARDEGLTVTARKYAADGELPEELKNRYDCVFTDPPYTSEGVKLFLSRAIETLDLSNQTARVYLCYGNSDRAKERFLPIYQIIIDSGLMLRGVFDKFSRYYGAESIGSTSNLFVLEVTPKTKILIKGKSHGDIYTV